jgi:hypothetical protein
VEPFGLDRLEQQIDRLKREYDLFLAGRRRSEPSRLRDEVARDVLRVTRNPGASTATRFRAKSLAHRFQALESQVRHLQELRAGRKREGAGGEGEDGPVLFDRFSLEEPGVVEGYVLRLHRAVGRLSGSGASVFSRDVLRDRVVEEVRRQLQDPGVLGVRFSAVETERGVKLRGEVVRASLAESERESSQLEDD